MSTTYYQGHPVKFKSETAATWLAVLFGPLGLLYVRPSRALLFFFIPIVGWVLAIVYASSYVRDYNDRKKAETNLRLFVDQQLKRRQANNTESRQEPHQ